MIKLTTYPSHKTYIYKTKSSAINDIKYNGLKPHEYSLIDTSNDSQYKSGIWLNKQEWVMLMDGFSINQIKIYRRK